MLPQRAVPGFKPEQRASVSPLGGWEPLLLGRQADLFCGEPKVPVAATWTWLSRAWLLHAFGPESNSDDRASAL